MAAGAPNFYHRSFAVTAPAGTAINSPLATSLAAGPAVLDRVEARVPPGPSGNVGFRIDWTGQQLVPWADTIDWIVADGEHLTFEIGLEVDSQLTLYVYNTDVYDHTLYLRLVEHDISRGAQTGLLPLLPPADIEQAAG